ncbi:MAG: GNAT family N-acetyltransferase [Chloroflexota bacterium]
MFSPHTMQIETFRVPDIFAVLRRDWNALLTQSASDTLFLTREFQQTWWEHCGADCELRVMTARDDTGQLVGIAPLYAARDANGRTVLRLIGGVEVADYLDLIAAREQCAVVWRAIVAALCETDDWHALDLRNIPAASPTREAITLLAEQHRLALTAHIEEVCPIIALPTTFEAYLESLDKKQRHEIRRKVRKAYAEADIHWYCVGAEHNLTEAVENFIALHQRSQFNKDNFMTQTMRNFFHALARRCSDAGWLELAFIEVNGQCAATYFNFAYNQQTLCYNSGYDPQAYAALSPGIVLLARLIEHAIQHGRTGFDFLQGNETYKYRMGAQDTAVYQLTVART